MASNQTKKLNMASKMAPTPFQMIGSGVKKGVKKVGRFLDKELAEPSRNYNRMQKIKDDQNRALGEAGEFN